MDFRRISRLRDCLVVQGDLTLPIWVIDRARSRILVASHPEDVLFICGSRRIIRRARFGLA